MPPRSFSGQTLEPSTGVRNGAHSRGIGSCIEASIAARVVVVRRSSMRASGKLLCDVPFGFTGDGPEAASVWTDRAVVGEVASRIGRRGAELDAIFVNRRTAFVSFTYPVASFVRYRLFERARNYAGSAEVTSPRGKR